MKNDITNNPLVSIIVPIYNAEKYLKRTLWSLTNQSYENIEIICVNDGSTDNSIKLLNAFKKNDKRIIVIDKPNGGPASARNSGLDAAKGKYVSFIDSDDEIKENAYSILVEKAENAKADVIVFGGKPDPLYGAPQWIVDKLNTPDAEYLGNGISNGVKYALFYENSTRPFMWLHFIKRDLLEINPKIRMQENLDLGEDQLFIFSYFIRATKVLYVKEKFYIYHWNNEGSLMWKNNTMRISKFKKHLLLIESVLNYWKDNNISDPYDNLISWALELISYDWNAFPTFIKCNFSKQILDIFNRYKPIDENIYIKDQSNQIQEMIRLSNIDKQSDEILSKDIAKIKSQIESVEKEIVDSLNSRAFKLGRILVKKRERINIADITPKEEKRN